MQVVVEVRELAVEHVGRMVPVAGQATKGQSASPRNPSEPPLHLMGAGLGLPTIPVIRRTKRLNDLL